MTPVNLFKTNDRDLAAYFLSQDVDLISHDAEDGFVTFHFAFPAKLEELMVGFNEYERLFRGIRETQKIILCYRKEDR